MMSSLFSSKKQAVEGFPMIPNPNMLLGHLPLMMEDDFRVTLYKFSQEHADSKGRCCFWMGYSTPALSVTAATDVQYVLKHSSHRTFFASMKLHFGAFLGSNNIGMLSGKEWKMKRAGVVKALHAAVNAPSYGPAIVQTTQVLVDSLLSQQQQRPVNVVKQPREIGELMKMLALDCFGQVALHTDFGCCSSLELSPVAVSFEFLANEMMRRMTWGILDPTSGMYSLPTLKNWQHAKHKKVVRDYIGQIIQHRQDELLKKQGQYVAGSKDDNDNDTPPPMDLLSCLIQENQQAPEHFDKRLVQQELSDSLLSLLFAGYETSSVTLTYALYLISKHTEVEQNCLEEINQGQAYRQPDDYHYLQAVLTETLRLYPPAISTTRALEKELVLDGNTVPVGTYLYVPIWVVQRDARNFSNPESFLPERWMKATAADDGKPTSMPPMADNADGFCAFSAGARSCPGQRFAMQEMTLALAVLLKNLSFQALDNYVLTPHRSGIVQTPKGGMPMCITPRLSS